MQKILIIRFSSIGDIVLTTPVIRCLAQQVECEIHYLTKKSFASILETNPYIKRVWTIEKKVSEIIADLQKEQFDMIIDLHKNIRSTIIKKKLGRPSHSFYKMNAEKWLIVNTKINRLPNVHIVDRYLKTTQHLGVVNDGKGLDFFISTSQESEATQFFQEHKISQPFIVLVIGAAHATKVPTDDFYHFILENINCDTIIVGGKVEKEKGEAFAQIQDHIYNAAGKLSIGGSAALIQKAACVVTPDTGMMHIAAALNRNIISIWGNTIPDFGMTPYIYTNSSQKSVIIENKSLKCRPCSKIGHSTCPLKHFRCMAELNPKIVVQTIKTMLI